MLDGSFVRELAQEHFDRSRPAEWFDVLYREARGNDKLVPWADPSANPNLVSWLDRENYSLKGKRVLVVGCGVGQDAEELAKRGGKVMAFDISQTAINWARKRFSSSTVDYRCSDLFSPPADFTGSFDFVLEAYTLQALPPEVRKRKGHDPAPPCRTGTRFWRSRVRLRFARVTRKKAAEAVASFVAPGGELLVICRARNESDPPGDMPWPLTERELQYFTYAGFSLISMEDYLDEDKVEVTRRFRALFKRNGE